MNPPTPTPLQTGKFLALIKEGHWEYVDRVNATGAAIILAVTAEQKICWWSNTAFRFTCAR